MIGKMNLKNKRKIVIISITALSLIGSFLTLQSALASTISTAPPAAFVISMGAGGAVITTGIQPIESAWYGTGPKTPPVSGPFIKNWAHIWIERHSRNTVLFLAKPTVPNSLYLVPYKHLSRSGIPIGTPKAELCDSANGCGISACVRQKIKGQCIVFMDSYLRSEPVVVVFAQWLVYGVSISNIKKFGPATDSASWGIESHP